MATLLFGTLLELFGVSFLFLYHNLPAPMKKAPQYRDVSGLSLF